MQDQAIQEAVRWLHSQFKGVLRFDENHVEIKTVFTNEGRLVAPVMVAMLQSNDTALYLPDEDEDNLHLLVTIEQFSEEGDMASLADRWRIYHGEPPDIYWAVLDIEAARFRGSFIDGPIMLRSNELQEIEARLCKTINTDHGEALHQACINVAGIEMENPVMVGIDQDGFDVRGMFDVMRLDASETMESEEDVLRAIANMAGSR